MLGSLSPADALALLLLIAEQAPERYERAGGSMGGAVPLGGRNDDAGRPRAHGSGAAGANEGIPFGVSNARFGCEGVSGA
jgi:hypothetical protein